VRQLLRLHGGSTLAIKSDGHGKGTSFEMRVMTRLATALETGARIEDWTSASGRGTSSEGAELKDGHSSHGAYDMRLPAKIGYRVLHAEDDAFVRMTLPLRTFKLLGIDYQQVEDGRAACEAAGSQMFHCIVLDNQMPILGGAATALKLRASGYRGLIIGMTGDPAGCDDRKEFEAAGLDCCTDKNTAGIEELNRQICIHAARLAARTAPLPTLSPGTATGVEGAAPGSFKRACTHGAVSGTPSQPHTPSIASRMASRASPLRPLRVQGGAPSSSSLSGNWSLRGNTAKVQAAERTPEP
jgi:CheY-like chemotaxis protein